MKRFFLNIIKRLYKRYAPLDMAEMTRIQTMTHFDSTPFDDLDEEHRQKIKEDSEELLTNETYNWIIDTYIKDVTDRLVYETNGGDPLLACRFSINGAAAIRERAQVYANYEREKEGPEDPYSAI